MINPDRWLPHDNKENYYDVLIEREREESKIKPICFQRDLVR